MPEEMEIAGARVVPGPMGALWWPEQSLLAVADLHFEKGSAIASRTGQMLPPYDTQATLKTLAQAVEQYQPKRIVCLGDNFHDAEGPSRLDAGSRKTIQDLMRGRRFVWIEGNHDAAAALVLGGESSPELEIGPLIFRHEPRAGDAAGEICGHLHPVTTVETRAKRLRRRCFVSDGRRCVMPALGAYTGGLDVFDPAFAPLFGNGFTTYVLGRERVYPFHHTALVRAAQ